MKYDKIKKQVGQYVYTSTIEGRDWNTMAVILLDKVMTNKPKPAMHYESFKEYADFAYDTIQNWDIRMVGKLRELFPSYFPKTLQKGQLICEYTEDGEGWEVFVEN